MKHTQKKISLKTTTNGKAFTDEERSAMKERALELRAEARTNKNKAEGEKAVLAALAKMKGSDSTIAMRIHAIVKKNAPTLAPKTWYGMPAYANRNGKVVCFFQAASKFNYRYATLGFQEDAKLDEGDMWPTSFALTKLTPSEEAKITALVKKAVGG